MKTLLLSILFVSLVSSAFALDKKDCRCRAQIGKRIVGGNKTNSWPWHVSVGWGPEEVDGNPANETAKIERHQCGGIILNENWVLSTADCVYGKSLRPDQINVGYASNDLVGMVDQNKLINVQSVVIHPDFNPKQWDANLALLRVATPFKFDDNLQPACLELDHPRKFYTDQFVTLGFGVKIVNGFDFGPNSRYLKQTTQKDVGESRLCRGDNLDERICTSGDGSVCRGDEGSPLQKITNGKSTVVGLVSHFSWDSVYVGHWEWRDKPCTGEAAYMHLAAPRFIGWIGQMVGEYCH